MRGGRAWILCLALTAMAAPIGASEEGKTVQAFDVAELIAQRAASGENWLEFLRRPALSMGIYALAAGAEDRQTPHAEDEVYYVLRGRGVLRVAGEDRAVEPGSLVFVAARAEHHFHSIREDLELLVFFAPAESEAGEPSPAP